MNKPIKVNVPSTCIPNRYLLEIRYLDKIVFVESYKEAVETARSIQQWREVSTNNNLDLLIDCFNTLYKLSGTRGRIFDLIKCGGPIWEYKGNNPYTPYNLVNTATLYQTKE